MFETPEEKATRNMLAIVGIIFGIIGFYLIATAVNWRLAAGLFFMMWGYALTARKA